MAVFEEATALRRRLRRDLNPHRAGVRAGPPRFFAMQSRQRAFLPLASSCTAAMFKIAVAYGSPILCDAALLRGDPLHLRRQRRQLVLADVELRRVLAASMGMAIRGGPSPAASAGAGERGRPGTAATRGSAAVRPSSSSSGIGSHHRERHTSGMSRRAQAFRHLEHAGSIRLHSQGGAKRHYPKADFVLPNSRVRLRSSPARTAPPMRAPLLEHLVCPACAGKLALTTTRVEDDWIVEGRLDCAACRKQWPVEQGVPDFVPRDDRSDVQQTTRGFARNWDKYNRVINAHQALNDELFRDWTAPLDPEQLRGKIGARRRLRNGPLDAGRRPRTSSRVLIGVDYSSIALRPRRRICAICTTSMLSAPISCICRCARRWS